MRKGDKDDNGWSDLSTIKAKIGIDYMFELTDRNEYQFNGCGFFGEDGKILVYSPESPIMFSFYAEDFIKIKFKEWK